MNGIKLRKRRNDIGISQAKFAELTGVSQQAISAYELGKTELATSTVEMLSHALADDVRINQLVRRKKRYRRHRYGDCRRDDRREGLCRPTACNQEYMNAVNGLQGRRYNFATKRTAFSIFSGCGGLSLGFASAGFAIKGHVEANWAIRRMYADNFSSSVSYGNDVTCISDAELRSLSKKMGRIDVLLGGPPCQGFSLSGKRDVEDPRNTLFHYYLKFVRHLRPTVALMENVKLLTSMKNDRGGRVLDDILAGFHCLGYRVAHVVVDAKDFGVPQHRERVLFIATSREIPEFPPIPLPTHGVQRDMLSQLRPYRTFGDACSDLDYIESGECSANDPQHSAVRHPEHVIKWLWDVPQGHSAHENDDQDMRPLSGYNTTYKRQIWNEPAATVQTTFGMISGCRNVHPIATRALTVREAARIQSFPDAFEFRGSIGAIRTAIGNAVPPLLAYALAKHWNRTLDFVKIPRL